VFLWGKYFIKRKWDLVKKVFISKPPGGVGFCDEKKYPEKRVENVENYCKKCAPYFCKRVWIFGIIFKPLQGGKVLHVQLPPSLFFCA